MIQLSEQQYGDIFDALGSARQLLTPGYLEDPDRNARERILFLLSLIEKRMHDGTIVREDVDE